MDKIIDNKREKLPLISLQHGPNVLLRLLIKRIPNYYEHAHFLLYSIDLELTTRWYNLNSYNTFLLENVL